MAASPLFRLVCGYDFGSDTAWLRWKNTPAAGIGALTQQERISVPAKIMGMAENDNGNRYALHAPRDKRCTPAAEIADRKKRS